MFYDFSVVDIVSNFTPRSSCVQTGTTRLWLMQLIKLSPNGIYAVSIHSIIARSLIANGIKYLWSILSINPSKLTDQVRVNGQVG